MIREAVDRANLYFEHEMQADEAEPHRIAGGRAVVFSTRAPDKETANEDSAGVIPYGDDAAALVVADGMGGGRGGAQASSTALRALRAALDEAERHGWKLRNAILNGIEAAHGAVRALGIGAATTLTVVEVGDGCVRPYHVGDSMVIVVGQRGKLKLQTISHAPVALAVEAGVLDQAEAMYHEDRHLVTNMIGLPEMRIEVGPVIQLAARDTVLLASDGLFDNLHLDEIVTHIRTGKLTATAADLAAEARQRMNEPADDRPSKPDDLTFVLFRRTHRWQPLTK